MTSTLSLRPPSVARYGACELQRLAHRYLMIALGISIAIHLCILALYFLLAGFGGSAEPLSMNLRHPTLIDYTPPSVAWPVLPGARILSPRALPHKFANPVPVPDQQALPTSEVPTQTDLSKEGSSTGDVTEGQPGMITTTVREDEEGPPPPFVPVEKQPVILHSGIPAYPPLAARAEIEGRVIVSVWVDKMGRPRDVRIANSTNEIFNEAALEAARKYLFIPAYMNAGPVSVWVTLAFNFRLR